MHACRGLRRKQAFMHVPLAQVVFNLHPTFPNPTREVLHHPFELEEYGWGEFELSVVVSCTSPRARHCQLCG